MDFACDTCNYKAAQPGDLKQHQQNVHEGMKYACDKCDYKATTHGSLKRHQQSGVQRNTTPA